ncbi:lipid A deacylase LpxR family protein [Gluconacetobacter sacchari]|uniref:Lipid A deacylase LpxR family protein n=1 Tax=Gluconacetobacter sacchari TaxID=92759 RepID=A0A7W4IBD3_9PROT|nr:lipid A deacylase LpxR family protein [Gluconacetobacter sacchari]MBB2159760.1 lipid A deacylase LpxR family protein [Gluconacetobacter sacchari]
MASRLAVTSIGLLIGTGFLSRTRAQAADLPPADPRSIITLQDENASISTASLTDRYYVNGLRLGYTSPTDITPGWMQRLGHAIWGAGRQRFAIDIAQSMFTPGDTSVAPPAPYDRPYAGLLQATATLIQDSRTTRDILSFSLGVMGPGSGAGDLQDGFHNVIGQGHDAGWHDQLPNQAVGEVMAQRTWRLPLARLAGMQVDVLPAATIAAGNVRSYGQASALFRIGQGLESDFGVARIQPGITGADAYMPSRPLVWYVFGGGDGQMVANDITLDPGGAPYLSHVSMINEVGEVELGAALIWHGVRISYTQVFQAREFHGQTGGMHQFGSLVAGVRF